ncbi:MAG: tetratricopeptide repeat protein [Bryobacterales bacterium]|nr:tetratricopeptide repeat protein [Bryobacterales bacterium]
MTALLVLTAALATAAEPPEAMQRARQAYDLARSGQFDAAIAELQEACRIAPANPLYRSAMGGILERQAKWESAVAAFREAIRLDPANPKLLQKLESVSLEWGAILARERRFRAGLRHAQQTAAQFPNSASVHLMLGLFQTRNQQNVAAVTAYRRALSLDPDSADASVGLAIAQSSAGLARDAEATLLGGLKKFPNDALHRQAYGVLLARMAESGSTPADRAIQMLESALAIDATLPEAHYQLGSLALANEDAAAALRHLEAAARNGLDDARLHYAMARALRRAGRAEDAARHMEAFRQRKLAEELGVQP